MLSYRDKTVEGSLAAERETWRHGTASIRTGLLLLCAAAWSRIGTWLWIVRDALDRRGLYTMGHRVDVLVVRSYERCVKVCGEIASD